MEFSLVILIIIAQVSNVPASSDHVTLEFITGVQRLNQPQYTDYYFSCGVVGRFLQWQYNNDLLSGFRMSDHVGRSLVNNMIDYEYTGTLLSSEPVDSDNRALESILVVSFHRNVTSSFTVTCTNGPNLETHSVTPGTLNGVINTVSVNSNANANADVVLDYVISRNITGNRTTHIFMCGVQFASQLFEVNGPPFSFTSRDEVGKAKTVSASSYAVNIQGIFVARSPFTTTSILIVVDESEVEVSCYYDNMRASLQSDSQQSTTGVTISTAEPNTRPVAPVSSETPVTVDETTPKQTETVSAISSTAAPMGTDEDRRVLTNITNSNSSGGVVIAVVVVLVTALTLLIFIGIIAAWYFFKVYAGFKSSSDVVKQEEGKQNSAARDVVSDYGKTKDSQKLMSEVMDFTDTDHSDALQFNQVPVQTEISDNTGSPVQIQERGYQFAKLVVGRSWKTVCVRNDGETFEHAEKRVSEGDQACYSKTKCLFPTSSDWRINSDDTIPNARDTDKGTVRRRHGKSKQNQHSYEASEGSSSSGACSRTSDLSYMQGGYVGHYCYGWGL